jgi:arylsulfatase A-like enzyme
MRKKEMTNKPNILWIGVDQMRADALLDPAVQTPNLDRLREQSILFQNAYSPSSLCTPSRGSMFTGLFAFKHGMGTNCDMYHALARELPKPEQLLHSRLREMGYRTGFTGKWHVGTELGPGDYGFEGMSVPGYGDLRQDEGYQQYLSENNLSYGPVLNPHFANPKQQTLQAGTWNGPLESTTTYYLVNYSLDLLGDFAQTFNRDGRPFFLTCQFWAPHGPALPSPEFVGIHERDAISQPENWPDNYLGKPRRYHRLVNSFFSKLPQTWAGWQEIIGLSRDYTTMVDGQIGRLLDRLDELGLVEDTLVIFTSDHGDMQGNHGLQDKGYMYQEAHQVPLLVRLPGQKISGQRNQLVYNMDIFPTILDLLGVNTDAELDGQSFLPYLDFGGEAQTGREELYLEFHGIRYLRSERALITRDGLKLIFNPADDDELYDLNDDPAEMHNLLASDGYQPNLDELRQRLIVASRNYDDPLQDCIGKWYGQWRNTSGQPDVSSMYTFDGEA